jgi:hypothetical protein
MAKKKPTETPPTAQPSAEPQSVETPAELKKFRVGHLNCADAVFEAADRLDAIEQFKRYAGILSTPHEFKVEEIQG